MQPAVLLLFPLFVIKGARLMSFSTFKGSSRLGWLLLFGTLRYSYLARRGDY